MKNEKDPLLDELEERIAEGPIVFTPDEEFLYLFVDNEWNGFSINHKYDDDYTILDTKIIPVEIPDFDVADDS